MAAQFSRWARHIEIKLYKELVNNSTFQVHNFYQFSRANAMCQE